MKLNNIESTNYTTYRRGRAWDNVTEYSFTAPESLNVNEFQELLKSNNVLLQSGWISFIKKQLTLKGGKTLYKHIAKLECSVN